jgi:nitrate reductase gamma subunit
MTLPSMEQMFDVTTRLINLLIMIEVVLMMATFVVASLWRYWHDPKTWYTKNELERRERSLLPLRSTDTSE